MYLDKEKYRGDHISVAEELMDGISQLEQKCRVIDKVVNEGDFTILQALKIYKVSKIDYFTYWVLINNKKLNRTKKQDQVLESIFSVIYSLSDSSFNLLEISNKSNFGTNSNVYSKKTKKKALQPT